MSERDLQGGAGPQDPMLSVEDLGVEFAVEQNAVQAVRGISFEIGRGEIVGLVGESGSGKSVTGMSLLGLIPMPPGRIVSGRARFNGRDLLRLSPDERRRVRGREIGVIFQEPMTALSPLHRVGRQLVEGLRLHRLMSPDEAWREAVSWLGRVGIPEPEERALLYPHQFSGGMRQRVMIALALLHHPALLIADEPTTALDVTTQAQIFDLILQMKDRDTSVLFITHDMGVIWELCDRVLVMKEGELVESGPLRDVCLQPSHPYTRTLIEAVPRLSDAGRAAVSEPAPDESGTGPLLQTRELRTWFPIRRGVFARTRGHVKAVDGVDIELRAGETLGLVGESGSGKTTLGRTLVGLEEVTEGTMAFRGRDLTSLSRRERRALRSAMQIVFQDPFSSLNPRLTIQEILTEGLRAHGQLEGSERDHAAALLEEVRMAPDLMDRFPHQFSGGQRQRICIARALSLRPAFIVCDEAVSALDVTIQAQVLDLLIDLQDRHRLAYLFITHDLSVVKQIAHRVAVMHRGRIVEQGAAEQIIGSPEHAYTRSLIEAVPVLGGARRRVAAQTGGAADD